MNSLKVSKLTISLILLAISPYAKASQLTNKDFKNIRTVLRGLNINESSISDVQIQMIHNNGSQFNQNLEEYNQRLDSGEVQLTCGGGSHGSGKDPV
ncbi:hypothetical protein [Bdellovibrio sp. HCB2-146]|uniref:hypothetical protein n=1 Tax=Bdellovibrio sp. HCB2-146 TaxID=3394362 RepID=UPI0039BD3EBD